jgi:hypothetical protein
MRLKFPDLTQIHAQFENPMKVKDRAFEISEMASKMIKKIEEPKLFKRLKERIVEMWSA